MNSASKSLQTLALSEDFLFCKVMSDPEICRITLEKILGISIKKIGIPTTQRTIDILLESKGVRLDVYAADDQGSVYCCEMQTGKRKELPKRSRYYHDCLDLDLISTGEPYEKLAKTIVIFICTFDPFKQGRHIYTFEKVCNEDQSLRLGDETVTIFLNTKGTVADVGAEMKEFLAYVENTTDTFVDKAESGWIRQIHQRVKSIRQSKEMEVEYMTLLQRDRENIAQGLEQGIEKGLELGENKLAKLMKILFVENRLEDAKRATHDNIYRKKLYEEYGI